MCACSAWSLRGTDEYFMGLESFRKAASYPEWLKFIGEACRLGAAGDEAEGLLALPAAFVQVSDVTESRLLSTMQLTAANHFSRPFSIYLSHLRAFL